MKVSQDKNLKAKKKKQRNLMFEWSEIEEQGVISSVDGWKREILRSVSVDQIGKHYFLS